MGEQGEGFVPEAVVEKLVAINSETEVLKPEQNTPESLIEYYRKHRDESVRIGRLKDELMRMTEGESSGVRISGGVGSEKLADEQTRKEQEKYDKELLTLGLKWSVVKEVADSYGGVWGKEADKAYQRVREWLDTQKVALDGGMAMNLGGDKFATIKFGTESCLVSLTGNTIQVKGGGMEYHLTPERVEVGERLLGNNGDERMVTGVDISDRDHPKATISPGWKFVDDQKAVLAKLEEILGVEKPGDPVDLN